MNCGGLQITQAGPQMTIMPAKITLLLLVLISYSILIKNGHGYGDTVGLLFSGNYVEGWVNGFNGIMLLCIWWRECVSCGTNCITNTSIRDCDMRVGSAGLIWATIQSLETEEY